MTTPKRPASVPRPVATGTSHRRLMSNCLGHGKKCARRSWLTVCNSAESSFLRARYRGSISRLKPTQHMHSCPARKGAKVARLAESMRLG